MTDIIDGDYSETGVDLRVAAAEAAMRAEVTYAYLNSGEVGKIKEISGLESA